MPLFDAKTGLPLPYVQADPKTADVGRNGAVNVATWPVVRSIRSIVFVLSPTPHRKPDAKVMSPAAILAD